MHLTSKHRKTLAAIRAKPARVNIPFADIEALLLAVGCDVEVGAGSRVGFVLGPNKLHLHRPHPGKEAKPYGVRLVLEFLERNGIT